MGIGNDVAGAVSRLAAGAGIPDQGGRAIPIRLVAAGNTDGFGDATLELKGLTPGQYAAWNLHLTCDGGGSFSVEIEQGQMPVGMALGTGGVAIGGPFITWGTDSCTLVISGAPLNSVVRARASGVQSPRLDDVINFSGPGFSSVGAHQGDPSKLIPGQVGPALIENVSATVPGTGVHYLVYPSDGGGFDVSGYAALLFYVDPPAGSSSLYAWLQWLDQDGTALAFSQIDTLIPKAVAVIGCLSTRFELWIGNIDSTAHNVSNLTVVPLAQMPAQPELLIPAGGGAFPNTPQAGPATPSAKTILELASSVPATGTASANANYVWPGKAIWSLGSNTGSSVTVLDGTLTCVDVNGVSTEIARIGNGTDNPPPVLVELTSGLAQVVVRNTGANPVNALSTLVATS